VPRLANAIEPAAVGYAARGLLVLPLYGIRGGVCTCGRDCGRDAGKHPIVALVPHGSVDASSDPERVSRWFRAYPESNIGLVLGDELVALDEDQPGAILAAGLELPNCPASRTARGHHYVFRANGHALPNGPFAPGLECKSGNGYVVAPPSRHISGHVYAWVAGHSLDDLAPPELPEAVERLILAAHPASSGAGKAKDETHSLFGELKLEGAIRAALAAEAAGNGDEWRRQVLAVVLSLVARGLPNDLILTICRRTTWSSYTHAQTDEFVAAELPRARAKAGRPKPDEEDEATFNQDDRAQAAESWPEPLDILGAPELTGWPELGPECLPAPLYRYVTAEAGRLGVDPCPLAAHVIAACSVSISDAWRVKPKQHDHWTQQPRIWSCVIKAVGSRGTDILSSAFWPFARREKALLADWKAQHAAWKARESARKKPDSSDPEPACTRLTTRDITVEKVSDILARQGEDGKLAVICDELVAFFGSFGRYGAAAATTARAQWLEAYDGGPRWVDRIRRGEIFVPNWSVAAVGNIQPRKLVEIGGSLINDGLFQRFMTVHTRPADVAEDDDLPLAVEVGHDYRELHDALAQMRPVCGFEGTVKPAWFDDEARAVRKGFRPLIDRLRLDASLPLVIQETAPKWSGLLARLSLVYHVVALAERVRAGEHSTAAELSRVTGATVTAAATFLRRIVLPNVFRLGFESLPDAGGAAVQARWIAGHIVARGLEKITARQIGRAYAPLQGKLAETAAAMAILCDVGWASQTEARQHNAACWAINPAVHTLFAEAAAAERERRDRAIQTIKTKVTEL
jgi:hypothetical protein